MFAVSFSTIAQAPGGTSPAAWYKADAGITPAANHSLVEQWNSQIGTFPLRQTNNDRKPIYSSVTTLANFNPTVTFDGSNDFLEFTAGAGINMIDRASGTILTAGYMNRQKGSGFAGFHASMDYPGLHFFNNYKLLFFTGGPGYQGVSSEIMTAQTYFSAGSGWTNRTTPARADAIVSLNGNRSSYTGNELYNANLSEGARNFRIGADNNWGAFSGQLNEVLVFEDKLSIADMDKVETYLAIKYGTTYANGGRDYVNAAGATIWATDATFKNNIAGIARDDNGALYQKQSWSTNAGQQVLIGVGGLANTNAANLGTLADGQYLIWADDGAAKTPTSAIAGVSGISHRFAAVWKVQNNNSVGDVTIAWPKGFTNLTLLTSADPTFTSGVTPHTMSATVTINGVEYNYVNVTLAHNQYFTFGAKLAGPGGVTAGLMMWHRADDGTTGAGAKNIWRDVSGLGRDVAQNNNVAYQPSLITKADTAADSKTYHFNFNPFYYFDGSNDFFYRSNQGAYFPSDVSAGSAYGVMYNSNSGGWRTAYGWGDDDPNLARANDNYQVWRNNGNVINQNIGATKKAAHIGGMAWKGGGSANNGVYMNIDGQIYSTTSTHIGNITNDVFQIGSEGWDLAGNGNEVFHGGISEVFAYSVDHQNSTGKEKQRINSYLAIKYGITLKDDAGTKVPNYLNSNADIIWDSIINVGYDNNIGGIARDDNSALYQKQSHSNQAGQQVLIGRSLANTNAANGGVLSEGQYLIWGDNGLAKAPAINISGVTGANYRFASVWKVQNTGSVGSVRVAWPAGLTNLTLVQGSDPNFGTFSTQTPMTLSQTINGVVYNYADVTLANGQYFTFAAQLNGPGGVSLNLRVWLRSDVGFSPDNWTDFSGNENHYTQTHTNRQPFTAAQSYNFNPAIDFGGSASADGRFMVVPSGKPFSANGLSGTFFTATLTREGGTSGYRDIWGFGNTTLTANLVNANEPAITKLNNDIVLYSSTTSAFSGQYPNNKLLLTDVSYTVNVAGIKYGLNGALANTNQVRSTANSLQANGSILGSQPEVNNGLIGEAIAYERDLSEDEKVRVRSYVAIKYGITLPHDYVAANGTTIFWDITDKAGYNNNIAGLARDDHGSLFQKQSNSIHAGHQVLISTTGLANSNLANTGSLEDQQFLVWGDNGLAKSPNVPFGTIAGEPYQRFAAIWKAQNTNTVGTVRVAWPKGYANLKLIQSDDDVFTTSDVITDMSGLLVINGIEYTYADVTIADGQYFTFAAFVRSPGGVAGPAVWLKANEGTSTTIHDDNLAYWINYGVSGGATEPLRSEAITYSKFQVNVHNFNPSVVDNTTGIHDGLLLRDVFGAPGHRALSSFVVQSQPNVGVQRTMISFGDNPVSASSTDRPWFAGNGNRLQLFWQDNYEATPILPNSIARVNNVPSVNAYYMPMWTGTNPHTSTVSMNGAQATLSGNSIVSRPIGNQLFIHGDGGNNNVSEGAISEVISYDRDLTALERQRLNSYLGIKYGITLHTTAGTERLNYLSSSSVLVWDAVANDGYNQNIAGIANDYMSSLHQKQSRSVNIVSPNSNSQVTIGLGEIAETNAANPNSLSDGQFLLWGDNGNTQTLTQARTSFNYGGTTNSQRMNRIWKTQNTGVNQEVLIRFPVLSVGDYTIPGAGQCQQLVLIVADNPAFDDAIVRPLTLIEEDDQPSHYDATYVFPNGARYFTYAKITPYNEGAVYLPEQTETTNEYSTCGVGEFTYFHKEGGIQENLFAIAGGYTDDLAITTVGISPQGADYNDGTTITQLMPRITTVDGINGSSGKVRIYYSEAEMSATNLSSPETQGWFLYKGNDLDLNEADEVVVDIFSDGSFDAGKATPLTPNATGVENGIAYVEFHNVTIENVASFVYISSTKPMNEVLPVTWLHFAATNNGNKVDLIWATASEQHNTGFAVERSTDGRNWIHLGFVKSSAVNGNSSTSLNYGYADNTPNNGINFYRLKQIDMDGKFSYSPVRQVRFDAASSISLFPNPTTAGVQLTGLNGNETIQVYDFSGKLLYAIKATTVTVQLSLQQYAAGVYQVVIIAADSQSKQSFKVVKQ